MYNNTSFVDVGLETLKTYTVASHRIFMERFRTTLIWSAVKIWVAVHTDMPPGTDCPYPIRILAFFEMIRPHHLVIRI